MAVNFAKLPEMIRWRSEGDRAKAKNCALNHIPSRADLHRISGSVERMPTTQVESAKIVKFKCHEVKRYCERSPRVENKSTHSMTARGNRYNEIFNDIRRHPYRTNEVDDWDELSDARNVMPGVILNLIRSPPAVAKGSIFALSLLRYFSAIVATSAFSGEDSPDPPNR